MSDYFSRNLKSLYLFFILIALTINTLCSAAETKYAVNLPPSAKLEYGIRASIKGLIVDGTGFINWEKNNGKYKLLSETRTALTGTLLSEKSEGSQDQSGLSPDSFFIKRFRKDGLTTQFDHTAHKLIFSGNPTPLPLQGGEQDRLSVMWQLLSAARAAPAQFKPGARFSFIVAGSHDAEPWIFEVKQTQRLRTGLGDLDALQIIRISEQNPNASRTEIWLAPALEWFPVRLRISENNGDYVEQSIESLEKK